MGYLEHQIDEMLSFLEREKKRYSIAFANSPEGTLQKTNVNGSARYVHCLYEPGDSESSEDSEDSEGSGRYIRRVISGDSALIRSLATKEYARLALKQMERNRHYVERLSKNVLDVDHDRIIGSMKSAYRTLPPRCFDIDSDGPSDWSFQREWASQQYEMSDYKPEEKTKRTTKGLYVRSKSEVLLIEKLYEYEIPFRYEQVIRVGQYELAPDLTFLDRDGKEFYLEYCGMMDSIGYIDHHVWKRSLYESIGIVEWDNMIYVFERNNQIHLDDIDDMIRTQIIPRL